MSTLTTFLKLIKPTRLEKYTVSILNSNSELIDAQFKELAKLPKGNLYTSPQDVIVNYPNVASMIIWNLNNVKLEAGRKYRLTFNGVVMLSTDGAYARAAFVKTPTTTAPAATTNQTMLGKDPGGIWGPSPGGGLNQPLTVITSWDQTSTETIQLKLNGWTTIGGGAARIGVSGGVVTLEDMGAV